jgi:predicted nucleic acid-binding protein
MSSPGEVDSALPLCLIDTSVWIPVLRRSHPAGASATARLAELQGAGRAVTAGPIMLELLSGARDEAGRQKLLASLQSLSCLEVNPEHWLEAAELGFTLRRVHGITAAGMDLLIATVAISNDVTLVHRDGDYDLIARHSTLRAENLARAHAEPPE